MRKAENSWTYGVDEDGEPIREDRPVAPRPPSITSDVADKWNEVALKALPEKQSTDFWELGGNPFVIVIEAKGKSGAPEYLTWARDYEAPQGSITMTEKGSLFAKVTDNRGKLTISGADNEEGVTAAIGRFSMKEIVHE